MAPTLQELSVSAKVPLNTKRTVKGNNMKNTYASIGQFLVTGIVALALAACGRLGSGTESDSLDEAFLGMEAELNGSTSRGSSLTLEEVTEKAIQTAYPGTTSVQYSTGYRGAIQTGGGTGYYGTNYSWKKGSYSGENGSALGGSIMATGPNGGKVRGGAIYVPNYGLVAVGGYCVPSSSSSTGKNCGIAVGGVGASGNAGYVYCTSLSGSCKNKKNW